MTAWMCRRAWGWNMKDTLRTRSTLRSDEEASPYSGRWGRSGGLFVLSLGRTTAGRARCAQLAADVVSQLLGYLLTALSLLDLLSKLRDLRSLLPASQFAHVISGAASRLATAGSKRSVLTNARGTSGAHLRSGRACQERGSQIWQPPDRVCQEVDSCTLERCHC